MLFMKGSPDAPKCGFSRQIVEILTSNNIPFASFDILTDETVRAGLKTYSDWPTFPQLYVTGEFVGGLDIIKEIAHGGDLKTQLGKENIRKRFCDLLIILSVNDYFFRSYNRSFFISLCFGLFVYLFLSCVVQLANFLIHCLKHTRSFKESLNPGVKPFWMTPTLIPCIPLPIGVAFLIPSLCTSSYCNLKLSLSPLSFRSHYSSVFNQISFPASLYQVIIR